MKKQSSFFVLLCALCAFVGKVNAQATYDVFTYTEPVGYKKEIRKGSIAYTKTDTKTGTYCIISLFPQTQSKGDIVTDFNSDWAALVAMPLHIKDLPKAENSEAISGWQTYSGAANFELNGGTSMALLTTAKEDNAVVSVLVITNTQNFLKDADDFLDNLKLNKPKVVAANSIKPEEKKEPTQNGAISGMSNNGIEGVWMSYTNKNILTDRVKFNWRIFFKDGKALLTMPDGGLYNFINTGDLADYWGKYSYTNKKGNMKSGNNLQFTDDIKYSSAEIITIQGEEYRRCKTVNGSKLNGTFCYYLPVDNIINTLPVGQKPRITFTQNGKFIDEGLFYQMLRDNNKDDAYNSAGSGIYELKDFSIILKYNDGRIKQTSFTIPASETTANATIVLIGRLSLHKTKQL
jgi:hypothetical protein